MVKTKIESGFVTIFMLSVILALVSGEYAYQERNHADQNQQSRALLVETEADAAAIMVKYGYVDCEVHKQDAGRASDLDPSELGPIDAISHETAKRQKQLCTRELTRKAIRKYQKQFKLTETGILDEATRKLMSEKRCGNKDFGDTEEEPQVTPEAVTSTQRSILDVVLPTARSPLVRRRRAISAVIQKMKERDSQHTKKTRRIHRLRTKLGMPTTPTPRNRRKRSPVIDGNSTRAFLSDKIMWRLLEYSARIQPSEQLSTLNLAFRMWSEVIPKVFTQENNDHISSVDIELAFAKGTHQNCARVFDGNGGELAHSWLHGDIHFDDSEDFKATDDTGVQLLRVAVHELGHSLGLSHSASRESIMYPIYRPQAAPHDDFELQPIDRQQIQAIYGVCKGTFDTVFDYVRTLPDSTSVYNTYFVRGNRYWMYDNREHRTRYGDPLTLTNGWSGLPGKIDSYIHVYYDNGLSEHSEHFFFAGDKYSQFDPVSDSIKPGYPRLISHGFGPATGQTEGIPDNIDASFFDPRNRLIYFFKGEYVYAFDENRDGCCEYKKKISEEFPTKVGNMPLVSNVDIVYYSYYSKKMYFIKGEDVWENETFRKKYKPRQPSNVNSLIYVGKWFNRWHDICDTD
ncbi:matrix metalloproteinase-21-like [Tubulanus polymorphus]|uniref:matrix metalloproteinase-21-like n=1 Tax=Tubulanus polymorphus TaxID=672921 RepID=UPI003DA50340